VVVAEKKSGPELAVNESLLSSGSTGEIPGSSGLPRQWRGRGYSAVRGFQSTTELTGRVRGAARAEARAERDWPSRAAADPVLSTLEAVNGQGAGPCFRFAYALRAFALRADDASEICQVELPGAASL
jgi:hypothetical protein